LIRDKRDLKLKKREKKGKPTKEKKKLIKYWNPI
jgi:hypothetical protein